MAKKKSKTKKKNTRQPAGAAQPFVRLSQCMIVKNEEKNIKRALGWAKDIAFEQIVVDTGSTDRTVELAEEMGAKVYHFEWVNDFAAAKNYAMDLAKGDWIAILDADEYMSDKDAKQLIYILKRIQDDPAASKKCEAITCTFVDLDDNGNAAAVISHQRVFRNLLHLRYEGKIHEVIKIQNGQFNAPDIQILHTGYTRAVYTDTNKTERNVMMLRNELERDPDNPDMMLYLADSLKGAGTKESLDEAIDLFSKALKSKRAVNITTRQLAYNFLIPGYSTDAAKKDEAMKLCNEAIKDFPDYLDYYYYRAVLNNNDANYAAAQDDLHTCEKKFMSSETIPTTRVLMPSPILLYHQLKLSAIGLSDEDGISKVSKIIKVMLTEGKDDTNVAGPYIRALLWHGATDEEALNELAEVYDFSDPKDVLFIARAAKDNGAAEFTRKVMKLAEKILG